MTPFEYRRAGTVGQALALMVGPPEPIRPLAGGTDLVPLLAAGVDAAARLVDLKGIAALAGGIEAAPKGTRIGALTTLAAIEASPRLAARHRALTEAAAAAATPQLRNMATLGGNLLQRPRCWYFRSPAFHCWLEGGDDCPARAGENRAHAIFADGPCVAVHPSDLAPALIALDAEVELAGPGGERTLPLADLFALPTPERRRETVLDGELVVAVRIPGPEPGQAARSTYLKAMARRTWSFALAGVAASVALDGDRVAQARIVLAGVAPIPWRARVAEQVLWGERPTPEVAAEAAAAALAGARPLANNAYKVALGRALVRRALGALAAPAP